MSLQIQFRLLASLCLFIAAMGTVQAQDLPCDANFVTISNNVIVISPTGVDDTANIQCALDFARDSGFGLVKLQIGDFLISQLLANGFTGTFQGTTRSNTTITVMDGSIDCTAISNAMRTPAAMTFAGGDTRLRFMTLQADSPCMNGEQIESLIHFTGEPADASCGNDVVFGSVDRINLEGAGPDGDVSTAITAFAEGHAFGTCRNILTGTFKANRLEIQGVNRGIMTSMQGGAQVDINFNDFQDSFIGYEMQRSNQNTTVAFNDFTGQGDDSRNYFALVAQGGADAPDSTGLEIKNNRFNLSADPTANDPFPAIGFVSFLDGAPTTVNLTVQSNTFNQSDNSVGVAGFGISKGFVANNEFNGEAFNSVWLSSFGTSRNADDWFVGGNEFEGPANSILLDEGTNRCVIGPAQSVDVSDSGSSNFIL
jgi:hypothetical protein